MAFNGTWVISIALSVWKIETYCSPHHDFMFSGDMIQRKRFWEFDYCDSHCQLTSNNDCYKQLQSARTPARQAPRDKCSFLSQYSMYLCQRSCCWIFVHWHWKHEKLMVLQRCWLSMPATVYVCCSLCPHLNLYNEFCFLFLSTHMFEKNAGFFAN